MSAIEAETAQIRYAGFWRRLAAYFIDGIIIGVITTIISVIASILALINVYIAIVGSLLAIIISIVYFVGFWAWLGQTPGKIALGVKVVKLDGSPIGFGVALLRYIGYIISTIILYIGFLMIAFHGQKRGLHDLIAGTIVISEPLAIQEQLTRAEREAALDKMDEMQREYHGV